MSFPGISNPSAKSIKSLLVFLFFISFAIFIALAPSFDLLIWALRYDEKRIFQVIILLLVAICIVFNKRLAIQYSQSLAVLPIPTRYALSAIFLIGLFSSFFAPSPDHAIRETLLFGLLFGFSLYVSILIKHNEFLTRNILLVGLFCAIFFYEIIFFTSYIGSFIQNNPLAYPEPFSNFSSVRFLNQFQVWTLPFIILPLLSQRISKIKKLYAFLFFINSAWWVILFASTSRGIILAVLTAVILTLLVFRKDSWPLLRLLIISTLSGFIAYLFLFAFPFERDRILVLDRFMSSDGRIQLWTYAIKMALEHPILGAGPGHYAYYPNIISAHPHNSILQIAAEWGSLVTVLLICLGVWGSTVWCKKYRENKQSYSVEKKHLWIALFFSITSGAAYSMVSGVIVTPLSQTMMAVILGLMLGLYHHEKIDCISISRAKLLTLRFVLSGMIIYMVFSIFPDVLIRYKMPSPPYNTGEIVTFGPRFWQEGGIPH